MCSQDHLMPRPKWPEIHREPTPEFKPEPPPDELESATVTKRPFVLFGADGEQLHFYIADDRITVRVPENYGDRETKLIAALSHALIDGGIAAEKIEMGKTPSGHGVITGFVLSFNSKEVLNQIAIRFGLISDLIKELLSKQ